MKEIAVEWKNLGNGQQKYVIMADKDKLRYQEQLNDFQKLGYFIMEDGQ